MDLRGIVTTAAAADNGPRRSVRGSVELRALWRAHRAFALVLLMLPLYAWATGGTLKPGLLVPTLLFMVLCEAEAILAPRLRARDREVALVAFRAAYALLVVFAMPAAAETWQWLAVGLLGLLLLNSALTLGTRALVVVTVLASVANVAAEATARYAGATPHAVAELAFVSLVLFPSIAMFLHVRGRRSAEMRERLEKTIDDLQVVRDDLQESQAQLRQWNRQLNEEVERQTKALEERNRYLSILNAVSFALAEPMDDVRALERAVRLVARLLGVRAAQAYTRPRGAEVVDLFVTVAPEDLHAPRLPEALLRSVARTGRPLSSTRTEWEGEVELPNLGEPYQVVPLVAKGRVLGSFALIGSATLDNDDDGRHLLVLVGREMGVALENARLFQEAVAKADREEFLTRVTRMLNVSGRGERALPGVLEAFLDHTGAREAVLVSLPEGSRDVVVAGTAIAEDAPPLLEALARSLTRQVSDRSGPLVLGHGGEAPISDALAAWGVSTIAVAPIFATRGYGPPPESKRPDAEAGPMTAAPTLVGALIVASDGLTGWGEEETSLLDRVADIVARRVQADELVAIQQQRIRELTGLAEVARTMQSGADVERLYNGFASALHRLLPYERLFIARMDETGVAPEVPTFGARGRPESPAHCEASCVSHAWFAARSALLWRRGELAPPSFMRDDVPYAVVVPMRPKGQMLGLAVVALSRPIRSDQVHIIEQAVEQLSLALDGASLYQQATARASRIQALSNLAHIVASVVNLREAFAAFSEEVRWLIPFDQAVMFLLDESEQVVEPYATYPDEATVLAPAPLARSLASVPILEGAAVTFRRDDPRYSELDWSVLDPNAREVAAVAVRQGDRTSAVFALVNSGVEGYALSELDALEEVAGLLGVTIERLRLYERAEYSAKHDLLTGLPNYRYLQERLQDLRAGTSGAGESSLVVVDMDNLKLFNDTMGHEIGDRVIEIVARELRAAARPQDLVARTGGDEFIVVMEGAGEAVAVEMAERVHEALHEAHLGVAGAPGRIGVSVGIATAPTHADNNRDLLHAADRAMYDAKFAGGQRTRTAQERGAGAEPPTTGRGTRLPETLVRIMTSGATNDEVAALDRAHRWLATVLMRGGTPPEAVPQARMLVAYVAMNYIATPQRDADWSLARRLMRRIRQDWEANGGAEMIDVLIPTLLRLSWLMAPRPLGEALAPERALSRFVEEYPQAPLHPSWPGLAELVQTPLEQPSQAA